MRLNAGRQPIRGAAVTVIVCIGAFYAFYEWCYVPYECNRFKRATEASMIAVQNIDEPLRRAMIARRNLEGARNWIARCPHDLDLYMIAGGSFRQLGLSAEAIPLYQKALTLDRRPEVYLNLGQSQAEAGRQVEAIPNLAAAVKFDSSLMTEVPASLQEEVRRRSQSSL